MDPGVAIRRFGKPYVWVTWITGLLAGGDQCAYAPWFKSRYKYVKDERGDEDFLSLTRWKSEHAAAVATHHQEYEAGGWRVTLEDANAFRVAGDTAVLAGKPDLVIHRNGDIRVIDVKTGKRREKDLWQVLVYLVALPRTWKHFAALNWSGMVAYRDEDAVRDITATPADAAKVFALMRVLGQDEAPPPRPSARECQWCDIPRLCCPDKIERQPDEVLVSEF